MPDANKINNGIDRFIDEADFNKIFQQYWNSVYHVCIKYTGSKEDAEEIAHDIFISCWKRRNSVHILNISAYLHQAAKLKSFNFIRNKSRHDISLQEEIQEPSTNRHPENELVYKELSTNFYTYCNQLPEPRKQIFIMSRQYAMSHKEISKKMNMSLAMVEYHVGLALRVIRKKMEKYL